ncbi:MAG: hypothetical protein LUC86_03305 [Prevotellaceae bacterium]|nr:hypothetical protein [Prevotellaceae bacterium]
MKTMESMDYVKSRLKATKEFADIIVSLYWSGEGQARLRLLVDPGERLVEYLPAREEVAEAGGWPGVPWYSELNRRQEDEALEQLEAMARKMSAEQRRAAVDEALGCLGMRWFENRQWFFGGVRLLSTLEGYSVSDGHETRQLDTGLLRRITEEREPLEPQDEEWDNAGWLERLCLGVARVVHRLSRLSDTPVEGTRPRQSWKTDTALKFFKRAVEEGFMDETDGDHYKWKGSNASLAYFLSELYRQKETVAPPWKELEEVFGKKGLHSSYSQIQDVPHNKPQKWRSGIDDLLYGED